MSARLLLPLMPIDGLSRKVTPLGRLREALSRPWLNEELRAAYLLRLASDFKIFPVLHEECALPLFLADYRYADFRDENATKNNSHCSNARSRTQ
jgi:hypothetical protein